MSRNAVFLTGNGASDDHAGEDWYGEGNNWVTTAWSPDTTLPSLLAALEAGQVSCGSLSEFGGGALNLVVDGECPMGSVSVSGLTARQLNVTATGMPAGSTLQVLQGEVDYAGQSALASNATMIASYPVAGLGDGSAALTVDTTEGSFIRTQVTDVNGVIIAASNPAWLLQAPPPGGIPPPRQA